jgi:hypothetical protein
VECILFICSPSGCVTRFRAGRVTAGARLGSRGAASHSRGSTRLEYEHAADLPCERDRRLCGPADPGVGQRYHQPQLPALVPAPRRRGPGCRGRSSGCPRAQGSVCAVRRHCLGACPLSSRPMRSRASSLRRTSLAASAGAEMDRIAQWIPGGVRTGEQAIAALRPR